MSRDRAQFATLALLALLGLGGCRWLISYEEAGEPAERELGLDGGADAAADSANLDLALDRGDGSAGDGGGDDSCADGPTDLGAEGPVFEPGCILSPGDGGTGWSGKQYCAVSGASGANLRVAADVRMTSTSGSNPQIGVFARWGKMSTPGPCGDDRSVVCVVTQAYGGAAFIAIFQGECTTYNYKKLALGVRPQDGAWYRIELELKGFDYVCRISGGELPSSETITWSKTTSFKDGKAGLWRSQCSGAFRDLSISPLP